MRFDLHKRESNHSDHEFEKDGGIPHQHIQTFLEEGFETKVMGGSVYPMSPEERSELLQKRTYSAQQKNSKTS